MITPYLHFQGNCAEALTAYQEALGGELTLMAYGDMPGAPPELATANRIMNAELRTERFGTLRASDFPPGVEGDPQQAVTVCLEVHDGVEQAQEVYGRLSSGGAVIQEFGPSFFADGFGMFKDRFGTHWMVIAGGHGAGA